MDIFSERPYFNSPTAPADDESYNMYSSPSNNNINYGTPGLYSSYAASYSSALSDSLAETPGVSVAPIGFVDDPVRSFGPSTSTSAAAHCKLEVSVPPPPVKLLLRKIPLLRPLPEVAVYCLSFRLRFYL